MAIKEIFHLVPVLLLVLLLPIIESPILAFSPSGQQKSEIKKESVHRGRLLEDLEHILKASNTTGPSVDVIAQPTKIDGETEKQEIFESSNTNEGRVEKKKEKDLSMPSEFHELLYQKLYEG
jgi:hypothetical protein